MANHLQHMQNVLRSHNRFDDCVCAQAMKQPKYSKSPSVVSFQEGIFYLLGGIFVLWLSNGGLVEIGVICIIWVFSLVSRQRKKKRRRLNPESDTSSDDEDEIDYESDDVETLIEETERLAKNISKPKNQ